MAELGDGNVEPKNKMPKISVIEPSTVPPGKLVKLLFLLDNGDKTSGGTEINRNLNIVAAKEAQDAFLSVLKDQKHSFGIIQKVLQDRGQELVDYPFISMSDPQSEAADRAVRKQDEDLLTFVQACHYLGIEYSRRSLDQKVEKVRQKLSISDEEMNGSFFIYAENLRMTRFCDKLTPSLVCHLLNLVCTAEFLTNEEKGDTITLNIPLDKLEEVNGLKEALFFYIIRLLEENDKLNRIYTDKLEELLEKLGEKTLDDGERCTLRDMAKTLSEYPAECRPAGHCVVFCVKKDRDGAQGEIDKVMNVFQNSLGFTVKVVEDPTKETLEENKMILTKQKYRFYDAIVYWFMCHGFENNLILADGTYHPRKEIFDSFSKLNNFRKKPKIFFMPPCRGDTTISVKQRDGLPSQVDNIYMHEYRDIPEKYNDINVVYYQMDRLIANATLPEQFAFRLPDGGSVYVDTVCRLLEEHRGENLTQVLERVSNKMHKILFSCVDKFKGIGKQACNYETTFQKTFIVPSNTP